MIGCGQAAWEYHWPFWGRLRDSVVTAVFDASLERTAAAAARFGARAYPSHESLIEEADIDALFVFLPPFAHIDQELRAARRGLPFFVEKPVGLDLDQVREVDAEVCARGTITSVGYNWRYSRPVERAREALRQRRIALLHGFWLGSAANGCPPEWWSRQQHSGGQLVEQTTHVLDLMRHIGGEVGTVHCRQARRLTDRPGFNIADVGTLLLEMESGAIGSLSTTCGMPHLTLRAGLQVTAEGVHIEVSDRRLRIYRGGVPESYVAPPEPSEQPYLREDQVFVDAVRSGDPSGIRCTYGDAVQTLTVCLASNESARRGRPIEPATL